MNCLHMRGYHFFEYPSTDTLHSNSPFFFDGSNLMGHVSNCPRGSMISGFIAILIRVTHCQTKRLTSDGTWTTQQLANLVWGIYLFFPFLD